MDKKYLLQALQIAKSRLGFTGPNPAVGALIVNRFGLVSYGFHYQAGAEHAEVAALGKVKIKNLDAAVMYVTLEPCSHYGKTPPCTKAIVESGIKKVVFGFKDPNPLVNNKSCDILQNSGIDCSFLQVDEIDDFYKYYKYWIERKKSWLSVKIATDLQGVFAGYNGPISITNDSANYWTHQQRFKHDALLTTAKTIREDDPAFSVRYRGYVVYKPIIIITQSIKLDFTAEVFQHKRKIIIIYTDKSVDLDKYNTQNLDIEFFCIDFSMDSENFWLQLVTLTASLGYHAIWAELGGNSLHKLLSSRVVCRYYRIINTVDKFQGLKIFDDSVLLQNICSDKLLLDNNELIVYNFLQNLSKG